MIPVTIFHGRSKCVLKLNNNLWNFQPACLSPNKCRIIRLVNKTTGYRAFDCPVILFRLLCNDIIENIVLVFLKQKCPKRKFLSTLLLTISNTIKSKMWTLSHRAQWGSSKEKYHWIALQRTCHYKWKLVTRCDRTQIKICISRSEITFPIKCIRFLSDFLTN